MGSPQLSPVIAAQRPGLLIAQHQIEGARISAMTVLTDSVVQELGRFAVRVADTPRLLIAEGELALTIWLQPVSSSRMGSMLWSAVHRASTRCLARGYRQGSPTHAANVIAATNRSGRNSVHLVRIDLARC